jgi:hypothetical protein
MSKRIHNLAIMPLYALNPFDPLFEPTVRLGRLALASEVAGEHTVPF